MANAFRTLGLPPSLGTRVSVTIRLKRNGPYLIAAEDAAGVIILDADGTPVVPEPDRSIALCRCGNSSTKPFCDRSHRESGFDGSTRWTGCYPAPNQGEPTKPESVDSR